MPLRMLDVERDKKKGRGSRRSGPGGATGRVAQPGPRPSNTPAPRPSLGQVARAEEPKSPRARMDEKKAKRREEQMVLKRNKGSKLTGEKGTTFKYKKKFLDKIIGSDEKRLNKIYAAGAAASRDANKISAESGKRFRGQTFKALEGPFKGITFKDTPSNRYNYERPGFFAKKKRSIYKAPDVRYKKTKFLTGGQAKIASKAPPTDKIDGKDFAVLRAEKAKGRGKGLQDEKMKPGKVMKAKEGGFKMGKGGGRDAGNIGKLEEMGMKARAGIKKFQNRLNREKMAKSLPKRETNPMKKMGGGMMKRYNKGGGLDMGGPRGKAMQHIKGKDKDKLTLRDKQFLKDEKRGRNKTFKDISIEERARAYALAQSMKDRDRLTERDITTAKKAVSKKMGGGMMQRPMGMAGYKKGTMIKARGGGIARSKPTKMY